MNLRYLSLLLLAPGLALSAEVTLPKILASHMVIQRDLPVHVWGIAAPGEVVSVRFRGQTRSTKAGLIGRWSVYLPPGAAGGPFELTVAGIPAAVAADAAQTQTTTLKDVLVGDVWVASGQSNMEFLMSSAATAPQDLPHAANPNIRLLVVSKGFSEYPQDDIVTTGWTTSTPESAKDFSAVAWYFAREIEQREHVPVGVIDTTWGGTPAEAWTRAAALGEDPALAPVFATWARMTEQQSDAILEASNPQRSGKEASTPGTPDPLIHLSRKLNSQNPGMLYNAMVAPLTPLPIRGVIWYQGESNSSPGRLRSTAVSSEL